MKLSLFLSVALQLLVEIEGKKLISIASSSISPAKQRLQEKPLSSATIGTAVDVIPTAFVRFVTSSVYAAYPANKAQRLRSQMSVSNMWQNDLLQTSKANATFQVPSTTELFTDSPKNFIFSNLFTSVQLIYSKDYPLSSTTPSTLSILSNSISKIKNSRKASSSSNSVTTLFHSQTSSHQASSRWNPVSISISALHDMESSAGSTERHFEESDPPHTQSPTPYLVLSKPSSTTVDGLKYSPLPSLSSPLSSLSSSSSPSYSSPSSPSSPSLPSSSSSSSPSHLSTLLSQSKPLSPSSQSTLEFGSSSLPSSFLPPLVQSSSSSPRSFKSTPSLSLSSSSSLQTSSATPIPLMLLSSFSTPLSPLSLSLPSSSPPSSPSSSPPSSSPSLSSTSSTTSLPSSLSKSTSISVSQSSPALSISSSLSILSLPFSPVVTLSLPFTSSIFHLKISSTVSSSIYPRKATEEYSTTVPAEEKAEEPTSLEPAEALQIWAAILTIENMEFTQDLANPSSQTFRKLSGTLTVLLSNVLKQISGFLSVHVKSFERGSVVCMFDIHANLESSAVAEDFEKALIDAANNRKIGNYYITNIQVKDNVEAVMKEETPQGQRSFRILLRVIAVIIFAVGVAVLIALFTVKAIRKKRRQRSEGFVNTGEVYPLSEFNTTNTEMGERKPTLRKKVLMSSDGELDEDANELTPFYKPGYAQA